jgi:hypothetical protein
MRIQYVSRLTEAALPFLKPVTPILVVAGGVVPRVDGWKHVISVNAMNHAVDVDGVRFLTSPSADNLEWFHRELATAWNDQVPVVHVTPNAPAFFLQPDGVPPVCGRGPLRAWIVGETPVAMNRTWMMVGGSAIKGASNPADRPGFCSKIYLTVSTEAVQEEVPHLQALRLR